MLQVGSVVDGKYVILREIGRGGMSVVYLALNERANKTWAIKEVRKNGATDFETTRQGLIAETNNLKKLRQRVLLPIWSGFPNMHKAKVFLTQIRPNICRC